MVNSRRAQMSGGFQGGRRAPEVPGVSAVPNPPGASFHFESSKPVEGQSPSGRSVVILQVAERSRAVGTTTVTVGGGGIGAQPEARPRSRVAHFLLVEGSAR